MQRTNAVAALKRFLRLGVGETKLQIHLERHPSLVAAEQVINPDVVISKLPLGANFVTDFVHFWTNSAGAYAMLTEIEAPTLQIFRESDDHFTSDFHEALQQLSDWRAWCKENRDTLDYTFEPLCDLDEFSGTIPSFRYIHTRLIVGRRKDVTANARRRSRWEGLVNSAGERFLRTWDGFVESLFPDAPILVGKWGSTTCFRYRAGGYDRITSVEC